MSNTIDFRYDKETTNDGFLTMSNGATAAFINVLCLSGGRLAKTESQKRFMVFLGERNQSFMGLGAVGFDIVEMPWAKDSFEEDKVFLLGVIDGVKNKLGWETLDYEPNEEIIFGYMETFRKLIDRMSVDDIDEKNLTEWLSAADADDPINCGFPKCEKHNAYISLAGCQVCTD